jgi:hypothetical protein
MIITFDSELDEDKIGGVRKLTQNYMTLYFMKSFKS